jgi:hypothetical protein
MRTAGRKYQRRVKGLLKPSFALRILICSGLGVVDGGGSLLMASFVAIVQWRVTSVNPTFKQTRP